jgi:hypothetical protein
MRMLMREAWGVLRQDRKLVLFPLLSGICSLLLLASFATPFLILLPWRELAQSAAADQSAAPPLAPWHYLLIFLFYLMTYFVVVFFNTGLVACIRLRLAGGEPTVRDGFDVARANAGRIFQWVLVSATVGTLFRALEERAGWLGRWVISLVGMSWSLATAFVAPVLVHEPVGPFEAVKRSAQAFRRTWGETALASIGLGFGANVLLLPVMAVLFLGVIGSMFLVDMNATLAAGIVFGGTVALVLVYSIALAILHSALQSIFLTACYQYATTGEVPAGFSRQSIVEAWQPKK